MHKDNYHLTEKEIKELRLDAKLASLVCQKLIYKNHCNRVFNIINICELEIPTLKNENNEVNK